MKRDEVIVAITRGHNASTTLMINGQIKWYLEEERITRRKYDGCPLAGLIEVSKEVDHIDELAICHTHRGGPSTDWTALDLYEGFVQKLFKHDESKLPSIYFADSIHHELHAACGFLNSGFEEAVCVIADGAGSFLESDSWEGVGFEFETIFKANWTESEAATFESLYKHIGVIGPVAPKILNDGVTIVDDVIGITKSYEAVTEYCGFQSIDAGKTMGLSPYGKENDELPEFIDSLGQLSKNTFIPNYPNGASINTFTNRALNDDCSESNRDLKESGQYTQVQMDMAYKAQKITEAKMSLLISKAVELSGCKNVIICGGYGLNCVANYKYWEDHPDINLYCEPIAHDGGISIGAAKLLYARKHKMTKPFAKQESIYYGPQYDHSEYHKSISDLNTKDVSYDDVAALIREGKIVTIFQGRSEGGPRALGNRSILFDPTIKDGKDLVNKVKHREFFRPFACTIKKENVNEYFDLVGREDTPHMMYAVKCKDGIEDIVPSVIHVDNTCRIQTLTKEQNEHYYNLIDAFEKLSGVPILFNTSFNLGGEPLVETIDDAIKTLKNSDIEYMYLPEIGKLVTIEN
jgi:carbamoyltransferase